MTPWFVVGGAGFIGTNLSKRHDCTTFDIVRDDDALDLDALRDAMDGHEVVVHLAANADIAAGALNPELDLAGIDITRNVCAAAREVGVKRIIYTSGSGVYGARSPMFPTEHTPCFPISSYGAAKLASEAILHAYEQYGIDVTIFRPANVVGRDQTHGVGYDFLRKLRADPSRLEILGDGQQAKGYLHVDDLLDAFETTGPGTYNIGPHDTLTVDEIAAMAIQHLGLSNVQLSHTGGLAWPGDIPIVRMSTSLLRMDGWTSRDSRTAMWQSLGSM